MVLEEMVKEILEDNLRLFPWRVKLDKESAIVDYRILRAVKEGRGKYIEQSYVAMLLRLENLLMTNQALALVSVCDYTRTFAGLLLSKTKQF